MKHFHLVDRNGKLIGTIFLDDEELPKALSGKKYEVHARLDEGEKNVLEFVVSLASPAQNRDFTREEIMEIQMDCLIRIKNSLVEADARINELIEGLKPNGPDGTSAEGG